MPPPSALRVGRTLDGFSLRVEGRATLREHPALLELFIVQVLDHAAGSLVVDLTGCQYLDDRFLATLLDLARHYGYGPSARFGIAAGDEAAFVPPMLFHASLGVLCQAPQTLGEEIELPLMQPGAADLETHLTEWHRRLAHLGERREPAFAAGTPLCITAVACP